MVNEFNKIDNAIQFTGEKYDNGLAYLDTYILKSPNMYHTIWYMKDTHSGNLMNPNAHLPRHVMTHMLINRFLTIIRNSSFEDGSTTAVNTYIRLACANGYSWWDVKAALHQAIRRFNYSKWKGRQICNENKFVDDMNKAVLVKVPYINDRCNAHIRKIFSELEEFFTKFLVINTTSYKASYISPNIMGIKKCDHINCTNMCYYELSRIIYTAICRWCNGLNDVDNTKLDLNKKYLANYIGKTIRTLAERIKSHAQNKNSAISGHLKTIHGIKDKITVDDIDKLFCVRPVEKFQQFLHGYVKESLAISIIDPVLNRKYEIPAGFGIKVECANRKY